jgi:hypothetical protein
MSRVVCERWAAIARVFFDQVFHNRKTKTSIRRRYRRQWRKFLAPDRIFVEACVQKPLLCLPRDPTSGDVIAVRIMAPGHKKGSGSDLARTADNGPDGMLSSISVARNKSVGKQEEKKLLGVKTELFRGLA